MYSTCIFPNQCKYFELKNALNIAVYAQTSGKSFAGQLVLRVQPVLSFDMLPFPKGDCLIQVWLYLNYSTIMFFIFSIFMKKIYHLSLINNTTLNVFFSFTCSFLIIRRVYMDIWHKPIFLQLHHFTQLILCLKICIN